MASHADVCVCVCVCGPEMVRACVINAPVVRCWSVGDNIWCPSSHAILRGGSLLQRASRKVSSKFM